MFIIPSMLLYWGMFTTLYVVIVIIRLVGEALGARVVPKWYRFHSVATPVTSTVPLAARMCQTVSNLSVYYVAVLWSYFMFRYPLVPLTARVCERWTIDIVIPSLSVHCRRFPRKRSHGHKNGNIFWCSSHHDFRDLIQRSHWKFPKGKPTV